MTSWISSGSMRRLAASLLVAGCAALAAPVHAFSVTRNVDGGYEYYFSASSLRIESAGDLDLSGLSFIESVVDGFRVGASFALDWLGGESARLESQAASWDGSSSEPRSLEISAGGNLLFGIANLSLDEGTIALSSGGFLDLGAGTRINVGTSGRGVITARDGFLRLPPDGSLTLFPGGDVSLQAPTPIPEPTTWLQLVAGLALLSTVVRRSRAR